MATYRNLHIQLIGVLLLGSLNAYPLPSYSASRYELLASKQNNLGHLGFQSKWQTQWFHGKESHLGGYWDTSFSRTAYNSFYSSSSLAPASQDFAIAAFLRYQRHDGTGFYAEAGTGPQYQSIAYDLVGRQHGGRLFLNTSAGIGFVWKNGMDLGFKASYLSRGQGIDGGESSGVIGIGLLYRW